ncbi:MAG: hypothetical protein WD768_04950 [Phycisphaeraceae bacterium]
MIVTVVVAIAVWTALPARSHAQSKEPTLADVMTALIRIEGKIDAMDKRIARLEQGGEDSDATRKVREKLKGKLDVKFEQNKLVNVMDFMRNTTGVNFFTDWAALEAAGIEQDVLITLDLKQVPADQIIKLVIARAGSGTSVEPLAWDVIDGTVMVSTERGLAKLKKK